jgi:chloride channel 3/4/5
MKLIRSITVALVVKGVLTIVTFGIKLPAGIFIPTLGVGACCGRILGVFLQMVEVRIWGTSTIIPGVYAMVGAAAALSGATVGPITLMRGHRKVADSCCSVQRSPLLSSCSNSQTLSHT